MLDCKHYIKHGTCLFGFTCKFNHPTPSEQFVDYSNVFLSYDMYQGMSPVFILPAPHTTPPFVPVYAPQQTYALQAAPQQQVGLVPVEPQQE